MGQGTTWARVRECQDHLRPSLCCGLMAQHIIKDGTQSKLAKFINVPNQKGVRPLASVAPKLTRGPSSGESALVLRVRAKWQAPRSSQLKP